MRRAWRERRAEAALARAASALAPGLDSGDMILTVSTHPESQHEALLARIDEFYEALEAWEALQGRSFAAAPEGSAH
jgi:L-aminopeptidase/D-esterase-like protein